MRLFIAINFEEEIKGKIQEIIKETKAFATQGKFVSNDHMHLTLEFLGEIPAERVDLIKNLMDKAIDKPFTMKLSNLGSFKRTGGDVVWLGIEDNDDLIKIQALLHELLIKEGFKLENRPYKPHITIGRKVKLKNEFNFHDFKDRIEDIKIKIDKIDLMESKHENGRLIYTIVYSSK